MRLLPGGPPTVVYLPGFNSDMEGRKARRIAAACRARRVALLRFDHRGHGASDGDPAAGSIAVWYRDALALLTARLQGDLVLVGASMGVWLMLLLARALGRREGSHRVCGMVGIGGAADFAGRLPALSPEERETLRRDGLVWRASRYGDGPYPLTVRMIEDGRRHRVLAGPWDPGCPVHLLHGMNDPDVPWAEAFAVAGALRGGTVRLTLIPDGDHRLSRDSDLARIERAFDGVLAAAGGRHVRSPPAPGAAIEPLDARRIRAALPEGVRLGGLAVHGAVDSTNTWLHARTDHLPSPYACLSEHQCAGRGRRGRTWEDASGRDLCLSVLWRFGSTEPRAQGLSLAIGVAAVRALEAAGARGLGLKWPNDVLWRDRKLGGILIEGSVSGRVWTVVIGVGVNLHAEPESELEPAAGTGPPRVHLDAVPGARIARNRLAARLIAEICAECERFEARGAAPALGEWQALDALRGRPVHVATSQGDLAGVARGVDEAGELLVEVNGRIERFVSAEVSLRAARTEPRP